MTVSFHKYGEYFPGTGELRDVGVGGGKYYAVNFPLRDGITDTSYKSIFEPVIKSVMEWYRPEAVVLQCGGDSLSGDRLGCFNLSMRGHANCVKFIKSFDLPTLILGGGGYTMRNVARTWAFETGILVGDNLESELPYNDYYEYFAPDYELDVRPSNMDNANTRDYLEKIRTQVVENLKRTAFAPSVQMTDVPRNPLVGGIDDEADDVLDDLDEDENKDKRFTQRRFDKYVEKPGELSESEDEEENAANGVRRQPNTIRRRNQTNYRNIEAVESGLESGIATPQEASSIGDAELDTKMPDIPRTEPDASMAAPGLNDQDISVADADRMVVEDEEKDASAAASRQPSPPHDEDTTMEDAAEPALEPTQPEASMETTEETKPITSPATGEVPLAAPLSPARASPTKESPAPAAEASAQNPTPGRGSEEPKSGITEAVEEPTKKEE